MNITIVGHVCIDNNISEHTTYTAPGSPAIFMSRILHIFPGVCATIISPYGTDFLPYVKNMNIHPEKPLYDWTLIYENLSHGNKRSQKAFNREYAGPVKLDKVMRNIVSASDIIFFAPITPAYTPSYAEEILSFAGKTAVKILLPQGYYRDFDAADNVVERDFAEADSMISLFDFVIVSNQDHKNIKTDIRSWSEKTGIIMTLGDKGSLYMSGGRSFTIPVEAVSTKDIVDSVGSGDIFSASFAYKYRLSNEIRESLEFANGVARQCLFYPATDIESVRLQSLK